MRIHHNDCVPHKWKTHFIRANAQQNWIPNVASIREDCNANEYKRIENQKSRVRQWDIKKNIRSEIKANGATHELVPPGEHRRNISEKSIQKHRNHFVGLLAGLHEYFPMQLWYWFIPHAEIQLNFQRQYVITTKISAYAHVHGPQSFMHKPPAPLGCPVLEQEKPDKRGSWSDHAIYACNFSHRCNTIEHSTCTENTRELRELLSHYFSSTDISPLQWWRQKIQS